MKLSGNSIIKHRSKHNYTPDFYAIVANPDDELPSHIPLPDDKTCAIIGVAGYKNWTDKHRQNVIVKILENSELTLILRPGQILERISIKLSKKLSYSSCQQRIDGCYAFLITHVVDVATKTV